MKHSVRAYTLIPCIIIWIVAGISLHAGNTPVAGPEAINIMSVAEFSAKTNPIIQHMFTADPSAHVFEGKMYVYPSHDQDDADWFNMRDYHVFSSEDLSTWVDHGVALDVDDVPWASEYMWAPDCAYKDGWYYLYFPAKDMAGDFRIGVASSQSPSGPFVPEEEPISGSFSVDPAVFIDDDGQAYMYFGGDGHGGQLTPWVAKLDNSMKAFSEAPEPLIGIDYWFEACWVNKIGDTYYLSYSTGTKHPDYPSSSAIAYATATDPMGPFTYQGIVNGYVSGWTNHHSIVDYKGQWYFFYHNSDLSGGVTEKRCMAADYLHFNDDGSIRQVVQTDRGIGSYDGLARIEAENYSETGGIIKQECNEGGFHVSFDNGDTLVFNNVDFSDDFVNTFTIRFASANGSGTFELRSDSTDGELLGTLAVSETGGLLTWQTLSVPIQMLSGTEDIYIRFSGADGYVVNVNWIEFTHAASPTMLTLADKGEEIHIYPHPADEMIYFDFAESSLPAYITLYDITGKPVYSGMIDNYGLRVDGFETGIYFYKIYTNEGIKYQGRLYIR